jgi:hypothetical protein
MNEEGKPSSRVLRPPGGGSSNIFGPPEPVQPSPSKPYQRSNLLGGAEPAAAAQPAQTKQADGSKDRLFGDAPPRESPKPANNAKGQGQFNPITGKAYCENSENSNEYKSAKSASPAGAYNPITGEAYDKPAEKATSSTRVRQPPGGASSGIF